MTSRLRLWHWLLLGLIAVLGAGLLLLPRQSATGAQLTKQVTSALAEWSGGTVTSTEPLTVQYLPPLSLRGSFTITGATKLPAIGNVDASAVKISLDLIERLMGRTQIAAIQLKAPTITLKSEGPAGDTASKPSASLAEAVAKTPVEAVRIVDGLVETPDGEILISNLDLSVEADRGSGALMALGSLNFRGQSVDIAVDSGAISDDAGVASAPLSAKFESTPLKVHFSGAARFAEQLEADGQIKARMRDVRAFFDWIGISLPAGDSLKNLTASGASHWNGTTLTVSDGAFTLDGNEAVGLLSIRMDARPRVEGTLAFEKLVLDPYFSGEAAAPGDTPFAWALLKYLDADLRISAADIVTPVMEVGPGGFTVAAKGGAISTEVGELQLCEGHATGRIGLDLSETRVKARLSGRLKGIAIETCLEPTGLSIPIEGIGGLKIDASTGGKTIDEMVRGLAGAFTVRARNGAVPIDLAALAFGEAESKSGWSGTASAAYKTLSADCSLSAGHVWCQSFNMRTPKGVVSGAGGVNLNQQTMDWDFLVANPVAPLDSTQLVMKKEPRVSLSGPLATPSAQSADPAAAGNGVRATKSKNPSAAPQ